MDRGLVKGKVAEMSFSSVRLDIDEIRELGLALGTDFLIFGKIEKLDQNEIDPANQEKLIIQITFRLISSKDGAVAGMVTKSVNKKGDVKIIVKGMIEDMVGEVDV